MKDLISSILTILRYMGRMLSVVRNTFFNVLFLLVLFVIIASFFSTSSLTIEDNSILRLSLNGDIVEERHPSSQLDKLVDESFGFESPPSHILLGDILSAIDHAAASSSISVIMLDLEGLGYAGLNQLQVIGKKLTHFKEKGKKVVIAQDFYTQQQYYLASYADEIILNPMGGVELHGFGMFPLYFKEALEKLKINYHVFRVGTYKSAIEPITRSSMSDEAKLQNREWLEALWQQYTADVGGQRGFAPGTLTDYVDNIHNHLEQQQGDTATLALEKGLVDRLMTREEFRKFLRDLTGKATPSFIEFTDYLDLTQVERTVKDHDNNGIGVIVAEGNIVGGNQPPGVIGSDSLTELIREARDDSSIKGVVLRINSGGGSAFASEIIRQEILELKKAGKPIVVSMGSIAASGGYWIAADADQIWAAPSTITGSIGIFGAIPTFEKSLAQLGVYSDGVGTTSLSSGLNLTQPLQPHLKKSIQLTIDHGYDRFISLVINGRNLEESAKEVIGEGRVFSAVRALELNLVDNLGTLDDAIGAAAELAGLDDFVPVHLERESSVKDRLLSQLTSTLVTLLPETFHSPQMREMFRFLSGELAKFPLFNDPHGMYAHAMLQLKL